MRADKATSLLPGVETRNKAQELIKKNCVYILKNNEWSLIKKASEEIPNDKSINEILKVEWGQIDFFVSRSGEKLNHFIKKHKILFSGNVLDVGQSTGGFTQVALNNGADKVTGVEVGHSQLHPLLAKDERVITFEKLNAREMAEDNRINQIKYDSAIMDVSFISQTLIYGNIAKLLKKDSFFIFLFKPQFETLTNKNDPQHIENFIEKEIKKQLSLEKLTLLKFESSKVLGKKGTQEYLLYGRKL